MAPRTLKNKTNKITVTTASMSQRAAKKKKPKAAMNPFADLDKHVPTIAILGERRENIVRIANATHSFDLKGRVPELLSKYPGHNLFLWGGSPELTTSPDGYTTTTPNLVVTLVPSDGHPPPFVAYSVKDTLLIQSLSHHKLAWKNVAPRVHILTSTKRMTASSINALSEAYRIMEEHVNMWTIIPREQLQRNSNGKYDIRSADYELVGKDGEPIYGRYEKGPGLEAHIANMMEEYEGEIGEDAEDKVKSAIVEAINRECTKLEQQVELLANAGWDEALLETIKAVKIYPIGTEDQIMYTYINKFYDPAVAVL